MCLIDSFKGFRSYNKQTSYLNVKVWMLDIQLLTHQPLNDLVYSMSYYLFISEILRNILLTKDEAQ